MSLSKEDKSILENSTRILLEMNEECEMLKAKYGERSKLYQTRRNQTDTLIEMQDFATNKINELNKALKLSMITNQAMEIAADSLIESLAAGIHSDHLFLLKPHG